MRPKFLVNILLGLTLLACVPLIPSVLSAGGHHCDKCCPQCDHCLCQPTPITIKVPKHCWEVECKQICVPAIRGPWILCCEPLKCGWVKTIKVLKKVPYECEKCGYKWEVNCVECCEK